MKRIISLLSVVLFLYIFSMTAFADVYLGTGDNVDSGGHLDWDYDTTYYAESKFAMNIWNTHKFGVIREDDIWVVQDLFVTDINSATAGYYGYRDKDNATIYFNIYYMEKLEPNQKKSVAAHEFGHALGLGHNTSDNAAIMGTNGLFPTTLHQDDKDSYDAAAEKY